MNPNGIIDLHTHTTFSDGTLPLVEHLHHAEKRGYSYIGVTDHVDGQNIEEIVRKTIEGCREFNRNSQGLIALPGAEITHVAPLEIAPLVKRARELGAILVVVHGETLMEVQEPGINHEAINARVDFLGHPGILDEEDAKLAAEYGVLLEISGRAVHSLGNGRTVAFAKKYGANLIINSDAHSPKDFYSQARYDGIALGAGLSRKELEALKVKTLAFVQEKLKGFRS
jgi:histidinol phosphatase-like PHP family hydrolase